MLAHILSSEQNVVDQLPSKNYSLNDLGAFYTIVMSRNKLQWGKAILNGHSQTQSF